jgi:hypothetical protein
MMGLMIDTRGHAALLYLSQWWICVQVREFYWPPARWFVPLAPPEFNCGLTGLGLWFSFGRDHRLMSTPQPCVAIEVAAYAHPAKPCDHQWETLGHLEGYDVCKCALCDMTGRWYDDERGFVTNEKKEV